MDLKTPLLPILADHIVDTLREPLLVLTADLRVTRANRSFYRTFAVSPQETEGRLIYDLGNGQWDIPELRRLLEAVLPQQEAFDGYEVTHHFESLGRKVMLLNARRVVVGAEGRSTAILLAIEDITGRRRLEDERRELETRFTSLVKNVRDHSIFTLDRDGNITSWNDEATRILRFGEAEVLGRHFSLIFTDEDKRDGIPEHELRTALNDGRAEDERWHIRKGGELFWALGIVTPTHDASGAHTGFSKILRDMTDRKRAETALQESEDHLRHVVELNPQVPWTADPEGNILDFSQRWLDLTGLTREQALGDGWLNVPHPDDRDRMAAAWMHSMRTGEPYDVEHRIRLHDGGFRSMRSRAFPRRDEAGKVTRWYGTTEDIHDRTQAEWATKEALNRAQRQAQVFDTALTYINDFAYVFDHDGRFTYVNKPLLDLWGLTLDEAVGKNFFDLGYPNDLAAKLQRQIQEVINTKRVLVDDTPYTSPAGVPGYYEYIFSPVLTASGSVEVVAGSTRVITSRKQLEDERERLVAALRNERSRLAAIVQQAPAFISVLQGPDLVFELANQRYYEIVGERDILGKSLRAALPELEGQGFFELLENVYRTGQTFAGDELPVQLRRGDDDALDERFMNLVYQALRDPEGTVTGIFVHGFDVTDLVRSREALRSSETRFRQLADSMPQMVWVTRPDGHHEYYNRRWYEFTGVPDGSTDGEGWNAMFHPDDQSRAWAAWRHSLATGDSYEVEYRLRHNTGEYRWTLGRALPIRDDDGKIERWFGTCTDIESLKRLEAERETLLESERAARDEAERASLMKDQFLATLSHELRTPLTAILLWSKLLRKGVVRDALGQAQALEAIEVSAEGQKQLIEDLLDISRMTSGKLTLSLQEVELEGVVHAALETVRPMAEAKGVELQLALGRRSGLVQADPDRIRQVIWNLLNNAVKFTDADGEVRVRVRRLADAIQIQVQDTGRGISGDFLPHVFERFRQQDATSTRTAGGLGLGLSIARQIIELHGGTIRAESDGPGKGASFTVELPIRSPAVSHDIRKTGDTALAVASESSASLHGVRVLLVEDEPATRTAIERLLRQSGADVTAVDAAAAAIAAFRTADGAQRYDILISDIGLRDRNGYQLIRDLREVEAQLDGERPITPAIALTAYARPEDREQALAAGFQTHVSKPVDPADLLAIVASLIVRDGR